MNGMILFLVVVLIYILMAFSRTTPSNRKPPQNPSERPENPLQPAVRTPAAKEQASIFEQMQMPVDDLFRNQTSRNAAPEETGTGSLLEALMRGVKDPAVYSGGDASSSVADRMKKELQLAQQRQKIAGYKAEEQRRMQADENARRQAEARARMEEKKAQLEEHKRKKEAAEREKSIGKARENATDNPQTAAAHAHAAGGCEEGALSVHSHEGAIDISGCLDEVARVMVCGPDTNLTFERDFIGEGNAMVSRALGQLPATWQ